MKEKSHNKKKEVKALIIRDILRRELSGQGLRKSEIEEDMKDLGIPKPNFEFHLYSRKKHQEGLITKKVIKSKKGNLSLNLKSLKSLAIIFEYLENDPYYGESISYLLDRAFKEAFYSEYGDSLTNVWRLRRFLREKYKFGYDIECVVEDELNRRIYDVHSIELVQPFPDLPQDKVEGILKKIDAVLSGQDLLGLLVGFAESLRRDYSIEFKIAYIIKALEIAERIRELETKKDERLKYLELANVSLLFHDNDEIMDLSNTKEGIFRMFVERIIRKALNENVSMDRSLKTDDSVLELFCPETMHNAILEISGKVSMLLNSYLFLNPRFLKEFLEIAKRREELGLKPYYILG